MGIFYTKNIVKEKGNEYLVLTSRPIVFWIIILFLVLYLLNNFLNLGFFSNIIKLNFDNLGSIIYYIIFIGFIIMSVIESLPIYKARIKKQEIKVKKGTTLSFKNPLEQWIKLN